MKADLLIAYDRHFEGLKEYRTPKRAVGDLGLRPFSSEH